MIKLINVLVLAVSSQFVFASNALAAKYGVVDMQAVILNVSEGKNARATLEKEIKAKEKEQLKEKAALDKMNEEWKSQAAVLSEAARMKKQQEFQERFLAARNSEMEFQQEIKRKEQQATQAIATKVAKLVEEMSKKKGLEVVFEANTAGLLYVKDPVDMTQEVVNSYEAANKVAVGDKKK